MTNISTAREHQTTVRPGVGSTRLVPIIDLWAEDFHNPISERYTLTATILTSNLAFKWGNKW